MVASDTQELSPAKPAPLPPYAEWSSWATRSAGMVVRPISARRSARGRGSTYWLLRASVVAADATAVTSRESRVARVRGPSFKRSMLCAGADRRNDACQLLLVVGAKRSPGPTSLCPQDWGVRAHRRGSETLVRACPGPENREDPVGTDLAPYGVLVHIFPLQICRFQPHPRYDGQANGGVHRPRFDGHRRRKLSVDPSKSADFRERERSQTPPPS